jgi:hypothetical protein
MPKGRPRTYSSAAERQREYLLRRRLRALESPSTTNYCYSVLRVAYAEIGQDPATTNILKWLDADVIYQACTRGGITFRQWFQTMASLPFVEMNRRGDKPRVRIAPVR